MKPEVTDLGSRRLNREAWLKGALDFLRQTGGSDLHITKLAAALGVTKGSFYHHFSDRDDFVDAVLQYWNQIHNLSVATAVETHDGGPKEKLRTLMESVYQGEFTSYDLPIRAWAMDNPRVRDFLRRSDRWRLDLVRPLFEALGFRGEDLEVRTRIFVTFMSLEVALYDRLPKTEILNQIDTRLDLLTRP